MEEILLIGGGGHCRAVIDVIECEGRFKIAGIIDKPELKGTKVLGYEVIGHDDDLEALSAKYGYALVSVGQVRSVELRIKLFKTLKHLGYQLPVIISPRAYVSKHAAIGEGTAVMHDALVNASAVVGSNCILNTKSLIEHDVKVEDHCHLSTGAILNGGTVVGRESFVGSHVTTKEGSIIGKGSFIKAGSVVK